MTHMNGARPGMPAMLYPFARPAATDFLQIVRGSGSVVYDRDGADYIDATSALWFCTVGHGRAEIADAVGAQMKQLAAFHIFERYSNDVSDALAETLVASSPMPNSRVFLVNSGSEAADSAIKLIRAARTVSGESERDIVIGIEGAFHGVSYAGISVGGIQMNKDGFGGTLPRILHAKRNDIADLERLFTENAGRIAAFMLEPVPGAAGVYPPPEGYLAAVRKLCDAHGVWLVFDEVITGFGRLATNWGATHFGVTPDLMMFAKGVTSGYIPMGGVLVGEKIRAALESDPDYMFRHGHTYSGHPAASAGALANLAILRDERLIERVPQLGASIKSGLESLLGEGLVSEVRGDGAMWAAGIPEGSDAVDVREEMLRSGRVLVRAIGPDTIAMSPPFVTEQPQIDRMMSVFRDALLKVRKG